MCSTSQLAPEHFQHMLLKTKVSMIQTNNLLGNYLGGGPDAYFEFLASIRLNKNEDGHTQLPPVGGSNEAH